MIILFHVKLFLCLQKTMSYSYWEFIIDIISHTSQKHTMINYSIAHKLTIFMIEVLLFLFISSELKISTDSVRWSTSALCFPVHV